MQSPPTEENTEEGNNDDDDSGWGISSVSAAFGGWGLTSSDPDQHQEDDEWKRQSRQMEDVAAHLPDQVAKAAEDAEHVLEDAVGEAAAAASSWFSGASSYFSGEEAAAARAAQEGGDKEGGDNDDNKQEPPSSSADALTSILQYNPLNSLAVGWINDLERESHADDPLRPIRDHLDAHLKDWPRSTYEEWVEESLVQLDKWDRGSAVVDETFYLEGSVHRRLWNDCMMADEMRCVLARKPRSATVATTTGTTATTTTSSTASSARVAVATAGGSTASVSKENITTATDVKKKEETASPSLQTNIETTKKATPSSSSAVSAAKDLLNEDDADLDELLGGGDEDDEICFVSPPNSGGL